jgi:hypothetical protein
MEPAGSAADARNSLIDSPSIDDAPAGANDRLAARISISATIDPPAKQGLGKLLFYSLGFRQPWNPLYLALGIGSIEHATRR